MSIEISAAASTLSQTSMSDDNRRSANFHPSIWGDHFLSYQSDDNNTESSEIMVKHQKLKEQVRKLLKENDDKVSEILQLIDAIQRLGISYHFETEIDEILKKMVERDNEKNELYETSLMFRLVRQQGYNMSCDVFNKYCDEQGNFKDSVVNDARGMLSLYEATHLRVHGERILDEALAFTTTRLRSMATQSSCPLADQISHALKQPIRKGLPRLEARNYFTTYEGSDSCNKVLLSFAKLDFNILQKQHQKEISSITRWWNELDFAKKLPFARNRIVECYFWILGVYFEPEFSLARRMLTKVIAMTSIIDDIYDVYGRPDELERFTAAIERWDMDAAQQLPEYMKVCYEALLDVYTEIEENMVNQGRSYRVYYAKEAMKNQVRAYHDESKWFHQQYTPTMEEYMPVALVTSAYGMLATTSLLGMGDVVTKDSFEWLFSEPKMVTASAVICRLMDDIVSHKFEQKRGHVASSIECYMKQHNATEEETVEEFGKRVTSAWKDVNEECLYPTSVPMPVLMRILNLARVIDVVYKYEDGYTHAGVVLKDFVSSLLKDPAPM